ncbi:MAG: hypothetical protein QGG36_14020 [Pirellulaceae bacterium]|jgi:hypothetical protein|nr:hypothetical protein [Pirellulaceae bacterium]MDP7016916.1 hypothetical protein [Pirellulaceae bacterium]
MISNRFQRTALICAVAGALSLVAGRAECQLRDSRVSDRERRAVELYEAGDVAAARALLDEAAEMSPADDQLAFNRGSLLAAAGNLNEAAPLLRRAAASRDKSIAVAARYNLGCAFAAAANRTAGDDPPATPESDRSEVLEHIAAAAQAFSDCLLVAPSHERAQQNLEILRLWTARMQKEWAERDRAERLAKLDLFELWKDLNKRQLELHGETLRQLAAADSIKRQVALKRIGRDQYELLRDTNELPPKLQQLLLANAPDQIDADQIDAGRIEEIRRQLDKLSSAAAESMQAAATSLNSQTNPRSAPNSQLNALDQLDDYYLSLAPFLEIVKEALDRQTVLLQSPEPPDAGRIASDAHRQATLAKLVDAFAARAEQERQRPGDASPPDENLDPEAAAQDQQLQQSVARAIQYAPQIRRLSDAAAESIRGGQFAAARTAQEQVVELLKKILESQQQQQNQQDRDSQEQNPQQPQDNQSDSQNNPQPGDPQDNQSQQDSEDRQDQQDQQDQQRGDQQQQQEQDSSAASESQRARGDARQLVQDRAEAMLQQVRERERKHREQKRALQILLRGQRVEKDW